jgi:hypothetical protein
VSIFKDVPVSTIFSDRGLIEADLVAAVQAAHDDFQKQQDEHDRLTGAKTKRVATTLQGAQVRTLVHDWLPIDLRGLADYVYRPLLDHVGVEHDEGEVPEVAIHNA